jgi:LPS O-antigen subunit length determinant protein (WzzB/FepE family)
MTPTFSTWDRATLDKFALEAYLRLRQQQDQLEQLRLDLKDAIAAYRAVMRETAPVHRSGV